MDIGVFSIFDEDRGSSCSISGSTSRHKTAKIIDNEYSFVKYDALLQLSQSNRQFFENDSSDLGQRFYEQSEIMINHIAIARRYVMEFIGFMHEYDFDDKTPGNGYRSLVKAMYAAIDHCVKICTYVEKHRGSLLFRRSVYIKEIEACNCMLDSLCNGFEEALKIKVQCEHGSLIPPHGHNATYLFKMCAAVKPQSFYGRCIGFQYCESIQRFSRALGIIMAAFSEWYYNKNDSRIIKVTSSLLSSSRYYRDPELRAKRLNDLTLYAGIDFSQALLSISERELVCTVPNMLSARVKINKLMRIDTEPLEMVNIHNQNEWVQIPIPLSHLGVRPVTVRLLSNVRRVGMSDKLHTHPVANSLLFHCHGGGFIAQTSKSHNVYLREWAAELRVPIVSVDYSLSPQAPYPRALEEIFFAYCWAIKNAKLLGTTAERIIVVGDSAGGYLVMALMLKCIEQSVRRPDGALLLYSPMIVGYDPSPSRCLSGLDIMLPFGFMMGFVKAYLSPREDQFLAMPNDKKKSKDSNAKINKNQPKLSTDRNLNDHYQFDIPRDPYISPLYASDELLEQLPPIKFLTTDADPFMDEILQMAKRLKELNKPVGLEILPGLPHGFLQLIQILKEANDGNNLCMARLAELLVTTEVTPEDPSFT